MLLGAELLRNPLLALQLAVQNKHGAVHLRMSSPFLLDHLTLSIFLNVWWNSGLSKSILSQVHKPRANLLCDSFLVGLLLNHIKSNFSKVLSEALICSSPWYSPLQIRAEGSC